MNKNKRLIRDAVSEDLKKQYRENVPQGEPMEFGKWDGIDVARSRDREILSFFLKHKESGRSVVFVWSEGEYRTEGEKVKFVLKTYMTAFSSVKEAKEYGDKVRPQRANIYDFGKFTEEEITDMKKQLGVE